MVDFLIVHNYHSINCTNIASFSHDRITLMKSLIYDLQIHELQTLLAELGQPVYCAKQIWQGLYKHYWQDPEEFTNLPKTLREQLGRALHFEALNTCQMRASCGSF